ncbi:MAG: TetR/AcrR family transcriptional regulator [Rubrobacter sp.]|nr:TetR/AcrR family transcriptional regulator [Rubrobacter sp.]
MSQARGARGQRQRGARMSADERRKMVLDAAIVEFASYGLHGVSTDTIAERVGVSQPYVIRLFGSKKELFLEAGHKVFDRILDSLRAEVKKRSEEPTLAMKRAYVRLAALPEELLMMLQALTASKDPEVRGAVYQRLEEVYAYVEKVTGESSENIRLLFAQAMLLTISASIDLYSVAEEKDWARVLLGLEGRNVEKNAEQTS